ncbi:MAG TPA: hypothetical protein VLA62_08515 [Solirubrobacterales bacterium]|nr:hypothetical protein [Solirubrobacterales bacterium]
MPEASWTRLEALLLPPGASQAETRDTRAAAESLLWALRRGGEGDDLGALESWRVWLADGSWVRFWSAYVSHLDARGKRAWQRALEQAGARLSSSSGSPGDAARRRVWWLVSLAVLQRELHPAL